MVLGGRCFFELFKDIAPTLRPNTLLSCTWPGTPKESSFLVDHVPLHFISDTPTHCHMHREKVRLCGRHWHLTHHCHLTLQSRLLPQADLGWT